MSPEPELARMAALERPHAPRHLRPLTRALWGIVAAVPALAFFTSAMSSGPVSILLAGFGLFWCGLCLVFFGSHLFRAPLSFARRRLWAAALLFMTPIAAPLFWWRWIQNAPEGRVQHA
ncbi:MAG: hypothetical protein AB8H86_28810 [Polyangiales bacterium]